MGQRGMWVWIMHLINKLIIFGQSVKYSHGPWSRSASIVISLRMSSWISKKGEGVRGGALGRVEETVVCAELHFHAFDLLAPTRPSSASVDRK